MDRHFSPFQSTGQILTTSSLNRSALLMALHCLFLIISARKGGKPKVNLGLFKKALDLSLCCPGTFSTRRLWSSVSGRGAVVRSNTLAVHETGKRFVEHTIIPLTNFTFPSIKLLNSLGRKAWEVDIASVTNTGLGLSLEHPRHEWHDNYSLLNFPFGECFVVYRGTRLFSAICFVNVKNKDQSANFRVNLG